MGDTGLPPASPQGLVLNGKDAEEFWENEKKPPTPQQIEMFKHSLELAKTIKNAEEPIGSPKICPFKNEPCNLSTCALARTSKKTNPDGTPIQRCVFFKIADDLGTIAHLM